MKHYKVQIQGVNTINAASREQAEAYITGMIKEAGLHDCVVFASDITAEEQAQINRSAFENFDIDWTGEEL